MLDDDLEKCMKELMRNSKINYSRVSVSVDARNVHFTGQLSNEKDRKHLEELAYMIQEIGSVANDVSLPQ